MVPGSHRCDFLRSPRCVFEEANRSKKQPSYRDCLTSMELVRTFTLCVSHALGAPLSPRNADTASHMQSAPSSASGGWIHTLLSVPSGGQKRLVKGATAVTDCRLMSLQSRIHQQHFEAHHRWCRREEVLVFRSEFARTRSMVHEWRIHLSTSGRTSSEASRH